MGRPFQSPFAKPPGEGLSSSTVNVLWGFANLVLAYGLILRVGQFDLRVADRFAARSPQGALAALDAAGPRKVPVLVGDERRVGEELVSSDPGALPAAHRSTERSSSPRRRAAM